MRFREKSSPSARLFIAGIAGGATAAAAPAAALSAAADRAAHGEREQGDERQNDQNVKNIHPYSSTAMPMSRTTYAAAHASAHCHSARPTAHLAPSSRRTDATAATQGV